MSREYVFTSWREPTFDRDGSIRYICWGIERCPTTDREHWQGFIVFSRTHRIPGAKRILSGGDDAHLEPRRGTRQQAIDYCRKCGMFYEWGKLEMYNQKELLQLSIEEIKNLDPLFYVRSYKGIEKYKSIVNKEFRELNVEWIWGEPGTGKTRYVMEQEDVYKIDPPYQWWDGYVGQKKLLIDDFEDCMLSRGTLLNILDGYVLRLPTKGGHCYANWTEVFITSNKHPEKYSCWNKALKRRVNTIREL